MTLQNPDDWDHPKKETYMITPSSGTGFASATTTATPQPAKVQAALRRTFVGQSELDDVTLIRWWEKSSFYVLNAK
jgi:hypothetical protein